MEKELRNPRTFRGVVIRRKMLKTITVKISCVVKHRKYGKYIMKSIIIHAHDEADVCKVGDVVLIRNCRPISKIKKFSLFKIIKAVNYLVG